MGNYYGNHYFIVTGPSGFWIVFFDINNATINSVGTFQTSYPFGYPYSRIYKYFDSSNNTFQFFYVGIDSTYISSTGVYTTNLYKFSINISDFSVASSYYLLPTHRYLIDNNLTLSPSNANISWGEYSIVYDYQKYFNYHFEDPIKKVAPQAFDDVLLFSFWDPADRPEELKLVLIPFTLDISNNSISYRSPIEKKYNPLRITPKIYKYTSDGDEFLYVNPPNNNYDYFVDGAVSKIDDLTLILRNFNETNFSFEVVGYKTFFDENYVNSHAITTLDYCYNDTCETVYSMYQGVGKFDGHYLVTKKSDRFLFVYVPQIYLDSNNYTKSAGVTYIYDVQSPLPVNYSPPSSETDIINLARNPWFVELYHPGLERWELVANDETYGPIYKNSKKIYLWGNVLVNYPSNGKFSINIESLFRGDGFLYPRNVLLALPALEDFSQTFVGSLHSPFATGSFLFFKDVKSTQSIDSNTDLTLEYLYSPNLSSFAFIAIQGNNRIPVALFSILNDKKPRLFKWFNIYGNISFFNTRRAFAPSRGFFSGSTLNPPNLPQSGGYKKVSNFYPLFSIDFPKLFSNYNRIVTFSSYIDGKDVKVNTIKSKKSARIAVNFFDFIVLTLTSLPSI
jgi:hypothetical protein